jgi:hypothetical protein
MTDSITNWYAAGGELREIQDICKAFQEGNRPDRTEQLTTEEVVEITETLLLIVEFCVTSMTRSSATLKYRDSETYQYARRYGKTMARVVLRNDDVPKATKEKMEEWLDREPSFPPIHIAYV